MPTIANLALLTPTAGRPEAFAHLESWVRAQADRPGLWVVATDDAAGYDFTLGQHVVRRPPDPAGPPSLCANLSAGIDALPPGIEKVLIVEDDDYYHPDYVRCMAAWLDVCPLVAAGHPRYYNVRYRRYRDFGPNSVPSLAQMGLRKAVLPRLREVATRGDVILDGPLWSEFPGPKHDFASNLHLGIKGLPGRPGAALGHGPDHGVPDGGGRVWRRWKVPHIYKQYVEESPGPEPRHDLVAPAETGDLPARWEGRCSPRPWQYRVTAAIPHLGTPDALAAVVRLLRLQSVAPYIVVVDTGSDELVRRELEAMRDEDLEVHYLRSHGWRHSSEPVAAAMDVAFALCKTPYLFSTHADCFLMRRDWLEWLLGRCNAESPVVGYRMSDRSWATTEWRHCVGHATTLFHMPIMWKHGISWGFERWESASGIPLVLGGGWPDTEAAVSWFLRQAKVPIDFVGQETNERRQIDSNIDHVRSGTIAQLYQPEASTLRRAVDDHLDRAIADAHARADRWEREA